MVEVAARPCLKSISAYLPGKPIGELRRELGLRSIFKLASNENPLGTSPKALKAIKRFASESYLYPEGSSPILRQALGKHLGLPPEWIVVGSGSDEIIRLICEAFLDPGDEAVVSQFGFIRFNQQSALMGAKVVEAPMSKMRYDLRAMSRAVTSRTKLMFIASPNNPTGTYCTEVEVAALLQSVPSRVLVVLDEAYYHYARNRPDYPESIPDLVKSHPNLTVLRTFSKIYGLAGLRLGFGVASPQVISWLHRIRMPFNVNLLAQCAGVAALQDGAFVTKSVTITETGKRYLRDSLETLGIHAGDSAANFLMLPTPYPCEKIFQDLLRYGIIVRPLAEYGLHHHLRVSVATPEINRRFIRVLRRVLRSRR